MALRQLLIISPFLFALAGCETAQENPNYKYSSTYGNNAPQALAQNSRHPDQLQTAAPVRYVNTVPTQQAAPIVQTSSQTFSSQNINPQPALSHVSTGSSIGASTSTATYTRVDASCLDGHIACQPVSIPATTQQAVIAPPYNPAAQDGGANNYIFAAHESAPTTHAVAATEYTPSLTENAYSGDSVGTPGYEIFRQSQAQNNSPAPIQSAPVPSQLAAAPQQPIHPVVQPKVAPEWPQAYTALGNQYVVKSGDTVYSLSRSVCSSVSEMQSLNSLDGNFTIKVGQIIQIPASTC